MSDGTIDQLECRTHDPNQAKWTSVTDAAAALGARTGRLYGWIYQGKVCGTKKEGGKVLIPACEMTRLLELHKAGTLDKVMWHDAQAAGAKVGGKRSATVKPVSKAVEKCLDSIKNNRDRTTARLDALRPCAQKSAEKRRAAVKKALAKASDPDETPKPAAPSDPIEVNGGADMVTIPRQELTLLIWKAVALHDDAKRYGLRVSLI